MKSENYITKEELLSILNKIEDRARLYNSLETEYNPVLEAKISICSELIELLTFNRIL